jgi:hypothetical protein
MSWEWWENTKRNTKRFFSGEEDEKNEIATFKKLDGTLKTTDILLFTAKRINVITCSSEKWREKFIN